MSAIKIIEYRQTCIACPSQWEGKAEGNKFFYIRFRHSTLQVGIADTLADAVKNKQDVVHNSDGDGFITLDEVSKYVSHLLDFSEAKDLDLIP